MAAAKAKLCITDLPLELQKNIFKHSTSQDLIALALVSKHFHSVACAQLYRDFTIIFPDEDDPAFDSPIDGLAGGLHTLVSSPHGHARHLKEISLDSLSGGEKGERAYKAYLYESSCGKFLSTLLFLTLKQANALEVFHWNIRVELSRPVFQALHQIPNLKRLHIRMHAGRSLYENPPPLPSIQNPPQVTTLIPPATGLFSNSSNAGLIAVVKPLQPPDEETSQKPEPRTFSGFKNLASLSILDMDTLDYLSELEACIRSSSSTLKELRLSLSSARARKARKPPVYESEESDQDVDDFGNPLAPPPPPPPPVPASEPQIINVQTPQEKEAQMRVERAAQDVILAKIFGLDPALPEVKIVAEKKETNPSSKKGKKIEIVEEKQLLSKLKNAMVQLSAGVGSSTIDKEKVLEALSMFDKARADYVKETENGDAEESPEEDASSSAESNQHIQNGGAQQSSLNKETENATPSDSAPKEESENVNDGPGLFDTPSTRVKHKPNAVHGDLLPEDIDMVHPDADDADEDEDQDIFEQARSTCSEDVPVNGNASLDEAMSDDFGNNTALMSGARGNTCNGISGNKMDPAAAKQGQSRTSSEQSEEAVRDYIRSTRKVALESFELHLIPLKTSIIFRAIDVTTLKHITLLNVGPQAHFWSLMAQTNKSTPLSLESVSSDDVTMPLLNVLNSLEYLEELFLRERSPKAKTQNLSPKTTVVAEDIRKLVLKKHIKNLTKLMIKNKADYNWDLNGKCIKLLAKKGTKLTELAISVDLRNFHLLLQYFLGLAKLRALHIVGLRTDDTCHTVLRELRRFAVDTIAQCPTMKLEYIAVDSIVERLIRQPSLQARLKVKKKESGKTFIKKGGPASVDNSTTEDFASASTSNNEEDEAKAFAYAVKKNGGDYSSSDESDGTDAEISKPGLKIETLENIKFYDIPDVTIFRKEVTAGRL
ncbi:hypothetical protein L228DRAFT_265626 [Xylona heveae TC161]|uniref:F-box domain-containing protein n=1 Tax=Xylona heveae (strain CBS 132557 / TC161) TaxID=1328760 RepID=A0A165INF4_XYLHT|nr:hypothetical protein L228DRAFT_265626 [Xylona heveae TC161]KZF25152.1 hypothetical protein L228DRAFT_265626 [Xylona heveae TC161]